MGDRLRQDLRSEVDDLDMAAGVETGIVVRAALDRLHRDDREILQLAAWEGLEPAAIATVLEIPPATARTRLHRARQRLRLQLDRPDRPDRLDGGGERCPPAGHVHHDGRVLVRDAGEDL